MRIPAFVRETLLPIGLTLPILFVILFALVQFVRSCSGVESSGRFSRYRCPPGYGRVEGRKFKELCKERENAVAAFTNKFSQIVISDSGGCLLEEEGRRLLEDLRKDHHEKFNEGLLRVSYSLRPESIRRVPIDFFSEERYFGDSTLFLSQQNEPVVLSCSFYRFDRNDSEIIHFNFSFRIRDENDAKVLARFAVGYVESTLERPSQPE